MTSKLAFAILTVSVWWGFISPAHAGCVDRITSNIANNFTSAIMCSNTLSNPSYQISYYESSDVAFSMFSFDKLNAGWICINYGEIEGENLKCTSSGLRRTPSEVKNGGSKVQIFDWKIVSDLKKFSAIFDDKMEFQTAKSTEQAVKEGCFVGLRDDEIYMAYNSDAIYPLSNCLFAFEKFLGSNPKVGLKLR